MLTANQVVDLLKNASVGLVPHLPYGNNLSAWPVKMFEFMASGLPLVYSDLPSHREIVGDRSVGIAVDPTNPETIANAIEFLVLHPDSAKRMGENARMAIKQRLNWESESKKLLSLYEEILSDSQKSYGENG